MMGMQPLFVELVLLHFVLTYAAPASMHICNNSSWHLQRFFAEALCNPC